jgi:hypothetical protein
MVTHLSNIRLRQLIERSIPKIVSCTRRPGHPPRLLRYMTLVLQNEGGADVDDSAADDR